MRTLLFVLLSILIFQSAIAQNNIADKLDELLTGYSNINLLNGSVFIAQNGKILINKGYGFSNFSDNKRNTADSKYQIYSITKSITATIILKLAEENRISLKDQLSKFYPSFPKGDSITIEHLLTHTSGIYSYNNDFSMPVNSEKAMLDFLQRKPLEFSPGSDWNYCNTGYFLLGFIIQKVTGMPYEKVVKKYIFAPLNMKQSGFNYSALTHPYKTTGYTMLYNDTNHTAPVYDQHELFSAGGIYSTTNDLYKFHEAMQANKIISKAATIKAYSPFKMNYGYGWFIDSISGKRIVSHSGGASGFCSYLVRIVEDNTVIILLCNSENSDVNAVKKKILNVLFDQPYKIPQRINVSKDQIAKFVGAYQLTPEMTIYISSENGRLNARPSMQKSTLLLPEKENSFYVDAINGTIDFRKAETGVFDTLVLTQKGKSYKGVRINPGWSLVGSSTPNGWNGPDLKLNQDSTLKKVWSINKVRLSEGAIKFRFNNDWTFNYGLDLKTNNLVTAGENIKVTAGVYNIILDLSNANKPVCTIKKEE